MNRKDHALMSGKGWHSGGLRRVGDDLSQISVHCQGRGAGAKDARRVMSGRATKGGDPSEVQRLTWGCIHRRFLF